MSTQSETESSFAVTVPYELKYFCPLMDSLAGAGWQATSGETIKVIPRAGSSEAQRGWEIHFWSTEPPRLVGLATIEAIERPDRSTVIWFVDGRVRKLPDAARPVGKPFEELRTHIITAAAQQGSQPVNGAQAETTGQPRLDAPFEVWREWYSRVRAERQAGYTLGELAREVGFRYGDSREDWFRFYHVAKEGLGLKTNLCALANLMDLSDSWVEKLHAKYQRSRAREKM